MDTVSDAVVREIWVQKSAQVGWTEILNNVIGYYVDQDPSPILMVQPTEEVAVDWSRDRLAPMIRDTPCLRGKFSDERTRATANTLRHKTFPGGLLAVAISNSPASLASKPIRIALFDEVDKYPISAKQAGDPLSLGRVRTKTFWNRKILAGSTPTVKGSSRVEKGFETSDQRYYFVPCPHCNEFQRLVWAQVKWSEFGLAPEQAVYQCVHCAASIEENAKADMLARGEWRASKPFNGIAGFHISELYSPWSSWGQMARDFLDKKAFPETLQQWINEALGETWEDSGEKLEPIGLMERRESYTAVSIPAGVQLLTVGTDVQDDRLEIFLYGWGVDEEAWRIEHKVLRGDPGSGALWKEHDDFLRRRFRTDDGRELGIEAVCVDSGGHFTEQVYRYCMARKRFRVWAGKGIAGPGRPGWPKKAGKGKTGAAVWMIGVDTIKAVIYGRLKKVTQPGPGYFHFDAGVDEEFFDQLTSEVVVTKMSMGRHVRVWKPKKLGVRQEALDGTVYAYAAMLGRGGAELLAHRAKIAPKRVEPVVSEPEEPPPPPPAPVVQRPQIPQRGGWVKAWRR